MSKKIKTDRTSRVIATQASDRTKEVKISADELPVQQKDQPQASISPSSQPQTQAQPKQSTVGYELHIDPAHAPNEIRQKLASSSKTTVHLLLSPIGRPKNFVAALLNHRSASTGNAQNFAVLGRTAKLTGNSANFARPAGSLTFISNKFWNTLEWLATSALIFLVLFFAVNFQAYSTLFFNKLSRLRGDLTPTVQNHPARVEDPLPLTASAQQAKKQIPALALEVAPPDDRIIIPRINKNVPVVKVSDENLLRRDWSGLEKDIQEALQDGVVHYPGTAEPGSNGNVVITGHSSYFAWDPGRFKDVFALLHEVIVGDTIIVYHDQQKYVYQVYETKVITPDKVDVLTQADGNRLTLITCTPVGTNLKRLVVLARPIK